VEMGQTIVQSIRSKRFGIFTFCGSYFVRCCVSNWCRSTVASAIVGKCKTLSNMGTPYIYTTTGLGLRKNRKMAGAWHFFVYMHIAPVVVYIQAALYLGGVHIHREIVYASHFLIFSRANPGDLNFDIPAIAAIARAYFNYCFVRQGSKICIRTRISPPRTLQTQKHRLIPRLRHPSPMENVPDQDSAKNLGK